MVSDLHENLLDDFTADYPEAVSAECDGHGRVNLQIASKERPWPMMSRCRRCQRQELERRIAGFTDPRFRGHVDIPDAVAEWATRGRAAEGLYLAGQVGTGKTHAAWKALAAWCRATGVIPHGEEAAGIDWGDAPTRVAPNVIFTRLTDLLDDMRPGDDSRQRVRDCQSAALLVIDDLGAEKPSDWTQERLYSVVDHRYANCMPLIVTGNLPPAKLAEQTGDRVASRLAQMCTVVPMTGRDRRRAS